MARQNIGNPKFYIDMLSFFKAQGSFASTDSNALGNLNPVQHDILNIEDIGASTYYDFAVQLDQTNRIPDDNKHFLAFLNHNFYDQKIFKPKIQKHEGAGLVATIDTFDEICNFPITNIGNSTDFSNNGWSLGEYDGDTELFDRISFSIAKNDTIDTSAEVILGSIAWGQVFQMPHSPDLKLTMTREYDGIKTQNTKGGDTLTQINYTGSPLWGSMPAWWLGQDDVSAEVKEKRQYGRGRRIWDLKFSYVSSDNLFPVNESISRQNPTDSGFSEGYNSSEFDSNDNFTHDAYDDTSFMSVVMGKTLGGALPFIFQPDGNNNSPDQFAICQIDQGSFQFKQVAHNVYDISLKIREVW